MNGNFNEDAISKIAEIAAERLITSRQQEIVSQSLEQARQAINESVLQSLSDFEGAISSAKNSIKDETRSVTSQSISSLRSEISTESKSLIGEKTKAVESKLAELVKRLEEFFDNKKDGKESDFNYTTRGTYEGGEVRFALTGQVLTPEEEAEFGNINYIEFGGDGGNFAFRLFPTTTGGDDPEPRIGVQYGEINGQPPSGMTQDDPFLLDCGTAKIWAGIGFNLLDGSISSRTINFGSSVPNNSTIGTGANIFIGEVSFSDGVYTILNQAHTGNINIRKYNVCENGTPKTDYLFIGGVTTTFS